MPAVAAFALREGFGSDITSLSFAVLVAPQVLTLGFEPALVLWAGRRHRGKALAGALLGMGLSLWLAALAPDLTSFGLAFALYAPASGVACGLAEASLMDARSADRERALTGWMLAGTLGDLAAPLLLWGLAGFGLGWRVALAIAGALLGLAGLGIVRVRFAEHSRTDLAGASAEPAAPATGLGRALLRKLTWLLSQPRLLLWLCAATSCTFMDEALAVLVGLRVYRETLDEALVAQTLLGFTLGGSIGLCVLGRCLKSTASGPLLVTACVGSAACFGAWVWLDVTGFGFCWLMLAGAFTTAHYPLTLARAYAALPEDSTLVAAASQAFGVFDLMVPLVLGLVADRFGVGVALCLLLTQPLGILAAVWLSTRSNLQSREQRGRLRR